MSQTLSELGVDAIKQRLASRYMDTGRMLTDLQDLVDTLDAVQARLRDIQAAAQ